MHIPLRLSSLLFAASLAAGCLGAETDVDTLQATEQSATDPTFRVYNIVEAVLPAANYDGVAGNECIALLNPEHRLRKIILVEPVGAGGTCALNAYTAGTAFSFTWGDSSVYQGSAGITALRAALSDTDGAVHRLTGSLTSEAATLAHLQAFLTQSDTQQASQIGTFTANRVHSLYDFEGQEEVSAEAAYQAVSVHQPCENPGSPYLEARVHNGFVYGYTAGNTGSCYSGWFTRHHSYNRNWRLVYRYDYSE
ncbi:hypothetical protein D7Y13_16270 [Corallococcus praedator]|uniref:Lipoprotein n=1 Tax=Corallococcus praedator TaxID=2316724 RepID=A0ABX9QJ72_9BACT|nr:MULTISPECIES: hypothetical protein [Corallococcus]RKH34054.1 hypothetical protein D7X75_09610 [Corallococcus sp. CA031C]RKI08283.1 hypothetical protein D7Y13_16270 [Corallococcus praedator]